MALKFYKLKVVELRGLITTFVEVTGEKLVRGGGCFAPPILKGLKVPQ